MILKIYKINDCDWYVASSLKEAISKALEDYDNDEDYIENPYELSDEELDKLIFYDIDTDTQMSFREALNKISPDDCPVIFASSEF